MPNQITGTTKPCARPRQRTDVETVTVHSRVENDSGFVLMPGRLLTKDEARWIAVNIAKLLDFPIFADGKRQIVLPITSFLRILPIA